MYLYHVEAWLKTIIELDINGYPKIAIRRVFSQMVSLLEAKDFVSIDEVFICLVQTKEQLSVSVALSFLSITRTQSETPSRHRYYALVQERLIRERGEAEALRLLGEL